MEVEEKAECPETPQPERRVHPRHAVDEDAALLLLDYGHSLAGRIIELSLGGCMLRTSERFLAGAGIRVEVTFKIRGIDLRLCGAIEWTDEQRVVGVRFADLTAHRRNELAEVLGEVETEDAAKAQIQAAEKPAGEQVEPQTQEQPGAFAAVEQTPPTRLASARKEALAPRAIVQPAESRPAMKPVASAPQPSVQPAGIQQQEPPRAKPMGRERRTQFRHEVDTSAVIFLINVGCGLHGRIHNLSLGGCSIRTDERFPVGIYTRVETEFRIRGLAFRLAGVIQGIHDQHHVGIRFLDMSSRKRELLEQLIAEFEESQQRRRSVEAMESGETSPEK